MTDRIISFHAERMKRAKAKGHFLMIDGRFLTEEEFLLLPEEPLYDRNRAWAPSGVPLGWVNIHTDHCAKSKHKHVVWQRPDGELRTFTVNCDYHFYLPEFDDVPLLFIAG